VALTEEMKQFLLEHRSGLTEDRVHVIANWAHEKKTEVTKEAFEAFGYEEENFIVSYFGNLGICQDVETMLDAAQLLKDDPKIRFLIVGHGTKFDYVSRQIQQRELTNVQLLPFLTGKRFEQAVAISDCCIVTLEKGLKGMCAPSKFYSYLQGAKPVLAVVEEGSYLQQILSQHQVGASVTVGEGAKLARLIRQLSEDLESTRELGHHAQELYDTQYAMEIGADHYRKLLCQLLK
jgi:glycosyltransferase involved in cell wall biosynthesis